MLLDHLSGSNPLPSFAETLTLRLANAIKAKRLHRQPIKLARWVDQFAILLSDRPDEEVERTLSWYLDHLGGDMVPQAYSAEGFRKKYQAIAKQAHEDPSGIKVSEEAMRITEELLLENWPAGADAELPWAVQKSLERYSDWHKRFLKFRAALPEIIRTAEPKRARHLSLMRGFVEDRLCESFDICKPKDFVPDWFRRLRDIIEEWHGWNGTIASLAFSPESGWFRKFGRQWSHEWFCESIYWDELMKEVGR